MTDPKELAEDYSIKYGIGITDRYEGFLAGWSAAIDEATASAVKFQANIPTLPNGAHYFVDTFLSGATDKIRDLRTKE